MHEIPNLSSLLIDEILSSEGVKEFQQVIYGYYADNKRVFPWRDISDAYAVVVSEIMLQQTQTDRVIDKYKEFLEAFPTIQILAQASLAEVLARWQGLGYNRRGKYLHELAKRVVSEFEGIIPEQRDILLSFKGIGINTAGSIAAFAFNQPTIFIETNIRSVFIHICFAHKAKVDDVAIIALIEQTLDMQNPRQWYYALMDYGVMLKKKFKNPSRKSAHHTIQSKFEGSDRQIRGKIIKLLVKSHHATYDEINEQLYNDPRISAILADLEKEQLVVRRNNMFTLPD